MSILQRSDFWAHIKQVDILIDDNDSVRISDFGLSTFSDVTAGQYATVAGGATPWLPPETFDPERFGFENHRQTPEGDIYSFACVWIEVSIHMFLCDLLGLMNETAIHG